MNIDGQLGRGLVAVAIRQCVAENIFSYLAINKALRCGPSVLQRIGVAAIRMNDQYAIGSVYGDRGASAGQSAVRHMPITAAGHTRLNTSDRRAICTLAIDHVA